MAEVINTIGRRKTAVARIYMTPGNGTITVNKKDYKANLDGGGITGQAEALRMAIARALCEANIEDRPALKSKGLLSRDQRMVERKKPGRPKARKRFQFSKR